MLVDTKQVAALYEQLQERSGAADAGVLLLVANDADSLCAARMLQVGGVWCIYNVCMGTLHGVLVVGGLHACADHTSKAAAVGHADPAEHGRHFLPHHAGGGVPGLSTCISQAD